VFCLVFAKYSILSNCTSLKQQLRYYCRWYISHTPTSASVTFYSTKSLSIKRRCSLSADPPIITQTPSVQASPLLHSPPETLSVRGRDIIAAFIQWPSSFEALKKLFKAAPLKSMDARLQQGNTLWCYGNAWEENRVSRPAICSWFWMNSSSRWTCFNAFLVNKMLTQ
jgi:hypothetical protein